jgi:hypothetical protein
MRLMAQRVGAAGQVTGIDVDAGLGAQAQEMLHAAGHHQCTILAHDLTTEEHVPGGPFDVVYARLLLFHLPSRLAVLKRLWDAVAPGGHLVVQDYDLRTMSVTPSLASVDEVTRVITAAFGAARCDIHIGTRLAEMFAIAGIGAPDGTDVAGRVEPLAAACTMIEATFRSVLPVCLVHSITTEAQAESTIAAFRDDATRYATRPALWPLLVAAWKRKAS